MNEYVIGYAASGSLIGLSIASLLYMVGGRNCKGIRRFGASFIIMATVCFTALVMERFTWWILALYPIKILEFIQGYSDNEGKGWVKRLGIALTSIASGVFLCILFSGGWWLLFIHSWLSLITTQFSFKNPLHASAEETLVCILNNVVLAFYPLIVS